MTNKYYFHNCFADRNLPQEYLISTVPNVTEKTEVIAIVPTLQLPPINPSKESMEYMKRQYEIAKNIENLPELIRLAEIGRRVEGMSLVNINLGMDEVSYGCSLGYNRCLREAKGGAA